MEYPVNPDDEFLSPLLTGANDGVYVPSHFLLLHGTDVFEARVRARQIPRQKYSPVKIAKFLITLLYSCRASWILFLEIGKVIVRAIVDSEGAR